MRIRDAAVCYLEVAAWPGITLASSRLVEYDMDQCGLTRNLTVKEHHLPGELLT